ncbi:hypothetical protein [Cellulomonas sp. PS-H5]|uniref:hypothetical protein n=1 Tax=Cellulomonas sp. PS-H5 TaxID=2820400 RepID=UPI001C4FF8CC|nr:hypothetical protein [Cellulomonas sp. PS-H5]MBW0254918.1 hypothetical protein [Cellulomonas sp. PS-H5]
MPPLSPLLRRALATLTALLLAVLVAPLAASAGVPGGLSGAADRAAEVPAGSPAPAEPAEAPSPVLLVGVTGLRWDDLSAVGTPALAELAATGAVGSTVVRSVRSFTCPSAGWLAVGAGGRADDTRVADGSCRTLAEPDAAGRVPGWGDYVAATDASAYDSRLGLLGDAVASSALAATGIGPGAAIALAEADGRVVGEHIDRPEGVDDLRDATAAALAGSSLVVVDAGSVRDPGRATRDRAAGDPAGDEADGSGPTQADPAQEVGPEVVAEPDRAEQVRALDARLGAVLDGARASGTDPTVLLVSVADSGRRAHLQVAAATGPGEPGGLLGSASTRQPGLLQTTDVAPTVLDALGIRDHAAAGALVGAPVRAAADDRTGAERVAALVDQNRRAQAVAPRISGFYVLWVGLNLALYAAVTVGLTRRGRSLLAWVRRRSRAATEAPHADQEQAQARGVLEVLRVAAVAVASIPVATFLANLVPWWRSGEPGWVLGLLVAAFALVASAAAYAVPAWRHVPLGPVGVVAAITATVLGLDVALGARLSLDSLMGPGSLVAGRFYGFGNPALALFVTATTLGAVALVDPLVRRGRRRAATAVVALTGLLTLGVVSGIVSTTPTTGANFGGPPVVVAGFLVLVVVTAGARLGWRRLVLVVGAGISASVVLSVLDWLRPADERTHLGRFVETVLDGGLGGVLLRKAGTNLRILLGSEQTLLAIGGLLLVVILLGRPARSALRAADGGPYAWLSGGAPLRALTNDAPLLVGGLTALGVALGFGFAINDSGVVVPATGVGLAVPLLVAACATWLLGRTARPGGPTPVAPSAAPLVGRTPPQARSSTPARGTSGP